MEPEVDTDGAMGIDELRSIAAALGYSIVHPEKTGIDELQNIAVARGFSLVPVTSLCKTQADDKTTAEAAPAAAGVDLNVEGADALALVGHKESSDVLLVVGGQHWGPELLGPGATASGSGTSTIGSDVTVATAGGTPTSATDSTSDAITMVGHTGFLKRRSGFFRAMFDGPFKDSTSGVVNVNVPSPDSFAPLLRYLYSGLLDSEALRDVSGMRANADFLMVDDAAGFDAMLLELLLMEGESFPLDAATVRLAMHSQKLRSWSLTKRLEWVLAVGDNPPDVEHLQSIQHASRFHFLQGDSEPPLETGIVRERCLTGVATVAGELTSTMQELGGLASFPYLPAKWCETELRELRRIIVELCTTKCCLDCGKGISVWDCNRGTGRTLDCKVHPGQYVCNKGWTCCDEFRKHTVGCKKSAKAHIFHEE